MIEALAFFGAFNPPTTAHIHTAEEAMHETDKSCVVFVPSKMSYIADFQKKSFAFDDWSRMDMLEKIAAENPWMKVCDHELLQQEQPRSYLTLCWLKKKGYHCSLLFGSDKLGELETGWLHVEEIAREFGMVCMARKQDDCEKMIDQDNYLRQLKPYIQIVHADDVYRSISSSRVRLLYQEGRVDEMEKLLPAALGNLCQYKDHIL